MKGRHTCLLAALVVFLLTSAAAFAQYPTRIVKIVATSAPGTAPDVLARMVGAALSQSLKQTFLVETRTGAGGNVAADYVAKSAPDGYTLLMSPDPVFTPNP